MVTSTHETLTSTPTERGRKIGPAGTAGRLILSLVFLGLAVTTDETVWAHWLIGLLALPIGSLLLMLALRRGGSPARWTGPLGYAANIGIGVTIFLVQPSVGFVFYGAALLLAAVRGYAGCEMLAFSNALLGRDDEIGCPVFSPIDAMEGNATARH